MQHPSQRFYSNHYVICLVLLRALFFSLYTLMLPGSTCREKSSFIVRRHLTGTAASCNSVGGKLASSVPAPTWWIWCNVHFGVPLQFLAMLVIFFSSHSICQFEDVISDEFDTCLLTWRSAMFCTDTRPIQLLLGLLVMLLVGRWPSSSNQEQEEELTWQFLDLIFLY